MFLDISFLMISNVFPLFVYFLTMPRWFEFLGIQQQVRQHESWQRCVVVEGMWVEIARKVEEFIWFILYIHFFFVGVCLIWSKSLDIQELNSYSEFPDCEYHPPCGLDDLLGTSWYIQLLQGDPWNGLVLGAGESSFHCNTTSIHLRCTLCHKKANSRGVHVHGVFPFFYIQAPTAMILWSDTTWNGWLCGFRSPQSW